jgi:hypothetical protein
MATTDPALRDLQAAVKGLLFPSESDAPLVPFTWPGAAGPPTEAAVRASIKVSTATPIERFTIDELIETIPNESRGAFQPLLTALRQNLTGIAVFKVGEITIDVYIVGRTLDGRYAGVRTQVVET